MKYRDFHISRKTAKYVSFGIWWTGAFQLDLSFCRLEKMAPREFKTDGSALEAERGTVNCEQTNAITDINWFELGREPLLPSKGHYSTNSAQATLCRPALFQIVKIMNRIDLRSNAEQFNFKTFQWYHKICMYNSTSQNIVVHTRAERLLLTLIEK